MPKANTQIDVAHVGDWIETHGISGQAPRRGQIVEVLGEASHTRYLVRWDEMHESILYPADGVMVIPTPAATERPGHS